MQYADNYPNTVCDHPFLYSAVNRISMCVSMSGTRGFGRNGRLFLQAATYFHYL